MVIKYEDRPSPVAVDDASASVSAAAVCRDVTSCRRASRLWARIAAVHNSDVL